ncbi:unnamed protein product [Camellia sinensis]
MNRCSACVFPVARKRTYHRSVKAIQRKTTGTSQMRYLRNVPRRFKSSFREALLRNQVQSFTIVTNSLSHSHMATSSHLPPTTDPLIRIRDPSLLWRWVIKKVYENRNGLNKESIVCVRFWRVVHGDLLWKMHYMFDEMPQTELVIGVLKRLKDFDLTMSYFRFVETKTNKAHCPEAYNLLLMVMDKSKKFDCLDQILEEMSLSGFGPSNSTCFDLAVSCVKSHKLREVFGLIESMRKFKFRPVFSAYTTLIMQELGYEVNVQLFTTLIRVFAKEGRVDAAISLLDEMKSACFDADIVLYNVFIDCFGKVGKVDMAWKFFHEMKANGFMPDDVTYTSMIGVLWKANRLNEAVELFEQMELNRKVPCAYAYNTMIMAYGSAGKFDEAYNLLE